MAHLIDSIEVGQTWTGIGGMGPTVKITKIDLDARKQLTYEHVPADREHPTGSISLGDFVRQYRPTS